jgi:hypothetical protein
MELLLNNSESISIGQGKPFGTYNSKVFSFKETFTANEAYQSS